MIDTISVKTSNRTQFLDITSQLSGFVRESGVKEGVLLAYVPHTTAGITINENADPSVTRDILMVLNRVVPVSNEYQHAEGNSDAHIKASLMGSSVTVIVSGGRLVLGTWQGVYFCEFDGPRSRKVNLKLISSE